MDVTFVSKRLQTASLVVRGPGEFSASIRL
jgi:hypothetical protein